jgi:hypothetical protein
VTQDLFSAQLTALRADKARLEAEQQLARSEIDRQDRIYDMLGAELSGIERAIKILSSAQLAAEPAKPTRAKPGEIEKAICAALDKGPGQVYRVDQILAEVYHKPDSVKAVLRRLVLKGDVAEADGVYRLVPAPGRLKDAAA